MSARSATKGYTRVDIEFCRVFLTARLATIPGPNLLL
jgi:hypothetical protein